MLCQDVPLLPYWASSCVYPIEVVFSVLVVGEPNRCVRTFRSYPTELHFVPHSGNDYSLAIFVMSCNFW